jgi:hypothetical protein
MAVNSPKKEQVHAAPGRHRRTARAPRGCLSPVRALMRSPARRLEIVGLAIGLAVGLSAALAWLPPHGSARASHHRSATSAPPRPQVITQSGGGPYPAVLNAEWAAYSDHSTCADWAGGDGVSAVRLSSSQIAWFFSDTSLGPAGPTSGFSPSEGFVHNSVVIQTLTSSGSKFVTMTGGGTCGSQAGALPSSVVGPPQAPGAANDRYWDEDGTRIGGTVVKFYNRFLPGRPPYVATGTVIAAYPVSQLSSAGRGATEGAVARPQLFPLPSYTPPGDSSPIVWGAAVLHAGNTVYVYGTQTPDTPIPDRQLYLARVPASLLTQFSAWQFYVGPGQWAAHQQDAQPVQPAGSGLVVSTGFSVVQVGQRYWLIQADPVVGSQDIDAYPADAPWGPFDQAAGIVLYRNSAIGVDAAHDYRIMYEARAEPALSSSHELVISYNVNSIGVTTGCVPMASFTNTVTQPRFIAVPLAIFGAAGGGHDGVVTTGASAYPSIAARDPSQWFDEWDYRDGCPPVPGVTSVQARPRAGAAVLSWPTAGLSVYYRVYLLSPGAASYVLRATVRSDNVTLTGLHAGTYLARVVPTNARHYTGPAAEVTFTVP